MESHLAGGTGAGYPTIQQQQPDQVDWYTNPSGYGNNGADNDSLYKGHVPQSSGGNYMSPSSGAFGSFEDEPPLLEELGIDIPEISKRIRAVLFHRLSANNLEELDGAGAVLIVGVMAALHLLMGKLHFGVLLGWSVVGGAMVWLVVRQLAAADTTEVKNLDIFSCCCVLGYCQIPLVVYSGLEILIHGMPVVKMSLMMACIVWSTELSSQLFVQRSYGLQDHRMLVAYPCLLVYAMFAMLARY
eukprot:TRINITY_DN8631_c0_g1_i1.p3 TRINITY_DN8631_c0_g1~~TRINITY_DN8631_c0_g1_i1.p3  ORF type:complete len:244 (+),score=42.14 TRINITY_DN8631_c0_g1_i1:253-984(+)